MLVNELEQISGIGKQTIVSLLKHFKSLKRAELATLESLEQALGKSKADIIYNYFQKNKS